MRSGFTVSPQSNKTVRGVQLHQRPSAGRMLDAHHADSQLLKCGRQAMSHDGCGII